MPKGKKHRIIKERSLLRDLRRKEKRRQQEEAEKYKEHSVNLVLAYNNKTKHKKISKKEQAIQLVEKAFIRQKEIRDLKDWKPQGKSVNTLAWSLIQHLYCKYPVAGWWKDSIFEDSTTFNLFVHIASGGSFYELTKLNDFKPVLTKKMCHSILNSKHKGSLLKQIRIAQVKHCGGEDWLAKQINNSFLADSWLSGKVEKFWFSVIQWMCKVLCPRPEMFRESSVLDLLDYLRRQYNADSRFSMKGRTLRSVTEGMAAWHAHLAKAKGMGLFEPCGINGITVKKENKLGEEEEWTISEILSGKELAAEGREMRHCVYSYRQFIINKSISIWSLKQDKKRIATIQVSNRYRHIKQVRGKMNGPIKGYPVVLLERWAKDNQLEITRYAL